MPKELPSAEAGTEVFLGIPSWKDRFDLALPWPMLVLEVCSSDREPACGIPDTEVFQEKVFGSWYEL